MSKANTDRNNLIVFLRNNKKMEDGQPMTFRVIREELIKLGHKDISESRIARIYKREILEETNK